MKKFLLFIILAFLSYGVTIATQQTVLIGNITTTVTAGDTIKFYDSGGATGNYGNNENFTHVFTTTSNLPIVIRFKSFQVESASYDYIYIYDGATISDPVLVNKAGGSTIPALCLSTGNNLTFTFRSDGTSTYAGWEAEVFLYAASVATPDINGILYVNRSNSAGLESDGSSWNNSLLELSDALQAAKVNSAIEQIWVAAGTYKPKYNAADGSSGNGGRNNAFVLVDGVKIYGGFAGTETNLSQRNWKNNPAILSGDIGTIGDNSDNAYHVVIGINLSSNTVLDGFTITGGNADFGGSITVNSTNVNHRNGGGIHLQKSTPVIQHAIISGNNSVNDGGGIYLNNASDATLRYLTIKNNTAVYGGGVMNFSSSPIIYNTQIILNVATGTASEGDGGGIRNFSSSSPLIINTTIADNTGSGMDNYYLCKPKVQNSILWGNTKGSVIDVNGSYNEITYASSLIAGVTAPGVILDTDPLFKGNGDYRLQSPSPCIDAGSQSLYSSGGGNIQTDKDLGGRKRLLGLEIDLGAYEIQKIIPDANGIVYVNKHVTGGTGYGNSWIDATVELADALLAAKTNTAIEQIWVASGTYTPLYSAADGFAGEDGGRDNTFLLTNGIKIYGGFVGNETSINQRDWFANKTILSGDIGVLGNNADNVYHVVVASGVTVEAVLDGITVTGGNANDSSSSAIDIGGISSPRYNAGGIRLYNSVVSIRNSNITGNKASYLGGGILNYESSVLKIENSTFNDNHRVGDGAADRGGGAIHNLTADLTVNNTTFYNNSCTANGGAINNQAGTVRILNCTFAGNSTNNNGGAFYNYSGTTYLYNSIFVGNYKSTPSSANDIYRSSGTINMVYNIYGIVTGTINTNIAAVQSDINDIFNAQWSGTTLVDKDDNTPVFDIYEGVLPISGKGKALNNGTLIGAGSDGNYYYKNKIDNKWKNLIDATEYTFNSADISVYGLTGGNPVKVAQNLDSDGNPFTRVASNTYYNTGAYARFEEPGTVVTTELDVVDPLDGLISLREAVMYAVDFVPDTIISFVDTVFYSGSGRNTIMLDSTIYIDKSICIKGTADTLINVASTTATDTIFDITKYVVLLDSLTLNTGKIVSTANIDIDASLTDNTAIIDMATNTTVTYNGTNQTFIGGEYHNLTVEGTQSGGGTITKILADDIDVKGNLNLNGTANDDYIILQGDGNSVQLTDYGQPNSNLTNINYIHIENVQFDNIIHLNNNNTVDSTDIKNAATYVDNIKVYIPIKDAVATALTYGDTLGLSTVTSATGVMARGQLIPGTLEFRDGAVMPKVSDSDITKYPLSFNSVFSPPYLVLDSTIVAVNKREIEVLIADDTITYGQDSNINYSAYEVTATKDTLITGDVLSGLSKVLINAPSGNVSSNNYYTAGTHQLENSTITVLDGSSADVSANYTITFVNGTLVVDTLGIDVINFTLNDKVYDGTNTTSVNSFGTLQTVIAGDDVSIDQNNVIAYFADKNAADNKAITQLSTLLLTGADAGNYKLIQQPSNLTATISKAELQFGITTVKDKEYDGGKEAELNAYTLQTPLTGDDVDVDQQASILEFSDKNTGQSKTVTVDTIILSGLDKDNYFVTILTPTSTASITPKELQVQLTVVKDKEYDGNKSAEMDVYTLITPISGDDVDIDLQSSILEFLDKNVGNAKMVVVDTIILSGLDKGNYAVKVSTPVPTASITAKELEIQITNIKDKVYDGNNIAELNTYTLVNPVIGDNVSVNVSNSSLEFSDKNVGNSKIVSVNSLILAGADKDNYTAKVLNPVPTASITARELQVQVTAIKNKEYDGNKIAELNTYSLLNQVSGDDVNVDVTGSSFEFSDKNVGNVKTVTVNSIALLGTDKNNYTVKVLSPVPTASITAKQLTVDLSSITVNDKVYDGTTAATMQFNNANVLNGIVGADNVAVNAGASTAAFLTSNAGINKTVNISIVLTGTDAPNYIVLQPNTIATIQQRPVTVTTDNSSKKFGEADPAFTYNITNGNLVASDQFIAGVLVRVTGEDPGQYDITANPAFSAGSNYDITFISAVFTIIPSDEADITGLYIDTEEWDVNRTYIIACDDTDDQLEIEIFVSPGATVEAEGYTLDNGMITLDITTGENIWKINYTVTAQDQLTIRNYTLVIKKHLVFDDVVVQKFDNVLVVNNNPYNNGGYNFVSYKWYSYKDNEPPTLISTKQYYSAGDNRGDVLDVESTYYVVLKTSGGDEFRTCTTKPVLTEPISVTVYPNPAVIGDEIRIDAAGVGEALLQNAQIELYNMAGNMVYSCPAQGKITVINAPGISGAYIIKLKTDEFYKNIGVIVK